MEFSIPGQEKGDLLAFITGDYMGRFNCT